MATCCESPGGVGEVFLSFGHWKKAVISDTVAAVAALSAGRSSQGRNRRVEKRNIASSELAISYSATEAEDFAAVEVEAAVRDSELLATAEAHLDLVLLSAAGELIIAVPGAVSDY